MFISTSLPLLTCKPSGDSLPALICGSKIYCLSVLTQILTNWSPNDMVDSCRSKLINVESGLPQGSDFRSVVVPPVVDYTLSARIGKALASYAEGCWVDSWQRLL